MSDRLIERDTTFAAPLESAPSQVAGSVAGVAGRGATAGTVARTEASSV